MKRVWKLLDVFSGLIHINFSSTFLHALSRERLERRGEDGEEGQRSERRGEVREGGGGLREGARTRGRG